MNSSSTDSTRPIFSWSYQGIESLQPLPIAIQVQAVGMHSPASPCVLCGHFDAASADGAGEDL